MKIVFGDYRRSFLVELGEDFHPCVASIHGYSSEIRKSSRKHSAPLFAHYAEILQRESIPVHSGAVDARVPIPLQKFFLPRRFRGMRRIAQETIDADLRDKSATISLGGLSHRREVWGRRSRPVGFTLRPFRSAGRPENFGTKYFLRPPGIEIPGRRNFGKGLRSRLDSEFVLFLFLDDDSWGDHHHQALGFAANGRVLEEPVDVRKFGQHGDAEFAAAFAQSLDAA